MAASSALRLLVGASRQLQSSSQALPAALRSFASAPGEFTRKDVVYFLDNRDDPEVDSAISAHLRDAYAKAEKGTLTTEPPASDGLELTAQVERKYIAAQIIESSIQNIAVPFAAETDAPIKRYISELLDAGAKAGLEAPEAELGKKLADGARGVGSVKEFLGRVQPLVPAPFHAALVEAVQAVEDATGATVALDGASVGYKQFAAKLKVLAAKHGVPVDLLGAQTDDAAKKYQAWQQGARVADVRGDLVALESEVVKALDNHLAKDSDEIRKSQQANLAAFVRRLEANKGQPWAAAFLQDLKAVEAFDAAVAANPQKGPVA